MKDTVYYTTEEMKVFLMQLNHKLAQYM